MRKIDPWAEWSLGKSQTTAHRLEQTRFSLVRVCKLRLVIVAQSTVRLANTPTHGLGREIKPQTIQIYVASSLHTIGFSPIVLCLVLAK